jgi:hypothetical protein
MVLNEMRLKNLLPTLPFTPFFGADGEEDDAGDVDSQSGTGDEAGSEDVDDDAADDSDVDDKPDDKVSLAELRKLRREAAGLRKRAKSAEEKVEEFETAQKTEMEKAQDAAKAAEKRAADAEQALVNTRVERAIERAAAAANFHDPADALAAFTDLTVLVDEDGNVDSDMIEEQLASLADDKPYFISTSSGAKGSADGGARGKKKTDAPKPLHTEEGFKARVAELHKQNVEAGRVPLPRRGV